MDLYGADLAHVHDSGHGDFARDAALGLLALLHVTGVHGGLVADLGCGSGIWAAALCDAGYDVLGIDQSAALLEIARRRAPAARLVHGSLFQTALPPCAAVTSIGECVTYGADPETCRPAFGALLHRIHAALRPGGLLVFDVVTPDREPRRSWREGADWVVCVDGRADPEARTYTRAITVFRPDGDGWRRSDEVHDVWMYAPHDVLADLRAAGFQARELDGYGDGVRFGPGHAGFAAVKPVTATGA